MIRIALTIIDLWQNTSEKLKVDEAKTAYDVEGNNAFAKAAFPRFRVIVIRRSEFERPGKISPQHISGPRETATEGNHWQHDYGKS